MSEMSQQEAREIAMLLIRLAKEDEEKEKQKELDREKFSKMTPVELLRYCVALSEERLRRERHGNY